mmetsp:Transcript_26650/g.49800  ORF Transcript_26650/g.49800 Transcript_26650/m.49800 type:complete len:222 (-) Transcript_26650:465-1130(-)
MQVSGMQKVIDPLTALMVCFSLSHFIIMVWKHKIDSSTVNIKIFANNITCHYRAFNVPSRTSGSPWGIPRWFSGFACLPQCKVIRVFLFGTTTSKCSLPLCHFFCRGVNARFQFSVIVALGLESICIKVDATIRLISKTVINNSLNVVDDLRYKLRHPSHYVRFLYSQRRHIFKELPLESSSVVFIDFTIRDRRAQLLIELICHGITSCLNDLLNGLVLFL